MTGPTTHKLFEFDSSYARSSSVVILLWHFQASEHQINLYCMNDVSPSFLTTCGENHALLTFFVIIIKIQWFWWWFYLSYTVIFGSQFDEKKNKRICWLSCLEKHKKVFWIQGMSLVLKFCSFCWYNVLD